jgi:peptidoglycan/xylan/chitin deacetylase (PgdA/CDA1 family)
MHVGAAEDGTTLDAAALPRLVDAVRERGYRFVTVAPYVR